MTGAVGSKQVAAATAGRPSGKREATERGKCGNTGTVLVGSGQLGSGSSGVCRRAELLCIAGKGLIYRVIGKQLNATMTGTVGKRAAFGKRRQRGLREGRAAMGGKVLGQGERDTTER